MLKIRNGKYFLYSAICAGVFTVGGIISLASGGLVGLRLWQKEWTKQGDTDLTYEQVPVEFEHSADLVNSLPFLASAAIDIDGDGRDEVFLGGGKNQPDAVVDFNGSAFVDITYQFNFHKEQDDATMGAASLDLFNDGYADLVVARESGIWLHSITAAGVSNEKLPIELDESTTPLSIAFGDVNNDGAADIYVSGYIKISAVKGETIFSDGYGGYSYLLLNNGDNTWRDATKEAGLWRQHNTFTAVFTDLDNDHDSDLVIAQDTGRVEMYENTGSFPMRLIDNPTVYSYPMGVAVGDYDNDSYMDLYFSNVGYTLPPALLRGDLPKEAEFNPEYILLHNEGGLEFSDGARELNAAKYGFGWGVVFADMNLDGHEDLLAAQNYARFPANDLLEHYPGKLLQFYPDENIFQPVEKNAGVENRHFGIAPIVSDFNNDGAPDLFWANLNEPALAYISSGEKRNWLKVTLENTTRSLNAIITLTTGEGRQLTKQFMTSQGLGSDQTRELIFGLGDETSVKSVVVAYQDGETVQISNPEIRTVVNVD